MDESEFDRCGGKRSDDSSRVMAKSTISKSSGKMYTFVEDTLVWDTVHGLKMDRSRVPHIFVGPSLWDQERADGDDLLCKTNK